MFYQKPHSVRDYFLIGFTCFICATVFFSTYKDTDILVSLMFYASKNEFLLRGNFIGDILRNFFKLIYVSALVVTIISLLVALLDKANRLTNHINKLVFVLLCLSIGPGLIANLTFKANWERARPIQIEQFGGTKSFSPPLIISDQCEGSNCSFVSGEASNIFSLFFALGLILRSLYRRRLFAAAIFAGLASGFVRIAQGAHFLSDVIYAGIFMWFTSLAIYWGVFEFWPNNQKYLALFKKQFGIFSWEK
ncbi:MAG: phosphatase PAP2 family protein [Desulfobulbia bacterium]